MTSTHTPPPHLLDAIIDGSVTTLVQRCEPQPAGVYPDGIAYGVCECMLDDAFDDYYEIESPFPAPGEPLTILDSNGDAVAEVVVVERGWKQVKDIDTRTGLRQIAGARLDSGELVGPDTWYFTAEVRKDGSYE